MRKRIYRPFFLTLMIVSIILMIRSSFLSLYYLSSNSMRPTLFSGDVILVNKMHYALKLPFSRLKFFRNSPKRGEIIVFSYPKDPSVNFIKRVVGVPGDTIEMREKILLINGQEVPQRKIQVPLFKEMDEKFKHINFTLYKTQTGHHPHRIQIDKSNFYQTRFPPKKVPKKKYFVLGDNRDFSHDSRFWGPVSEDLIQGRPLFIILSLKLSLNPFQRPWRFTVKRMGLAPK